MKKIVWEHWESFTDFADEEVMPEIEEDSIFADLPPGMGLLNTLDLNGPITVDTPLGRYHATDTMLPTRMFDCWVMHTNFDVDMRCANRIAKVPGVEVASIMTRYRVFIGIGKLFDSAETKLALQKALLDDTEEVEMPIVSEDEAKEHEYWAGLIDENGASHYICTDNAEDENYGAALVALRKIAEVYEYELSESPENVVYLREDKEQL